MKGIAELIAVGSYQRNRLNSSFFVFLEFRRTIIMIVMQRGKQLAVVSLDLLYLVNKIKHIQ